MSCGMKSSSVTSCDEGDLTCNRETERYANIIQSLENVQVNNSFSMIVEF